MRVCVSVGIERPRTVDAASTIEQQECVARRLIRDTLLLSITVFLVGWGLNVLVERTIQEDGYRSIEGAFSSTAALARDQVAGLDAEEAQQALPSSGTLGQWSVVDIDPELRREIDASPERLRPFLRISQDELSFSMLVPVQGADYALRLGPMPWDVDLPVGVLILILVTVFVIALAASVALRWPDIRRVRTIEGTARAISGGEFAARVGPQGSDEIGALARHFDTMAGEVQRRIEQQRSLLHAIAHEYRTPLARARFGLDSLFETGEDDPKARTRQYRRADAALTDLDNLVSEVLELSRLGTSDEGIQESNVPMAPLAWAVVEELREAGLGDVDVDVRADSVSVNADPRHVHRVVLNLISNAMNHASRQVAVRIEGDDQLAIIDIEDDGPGIPPDRRDDVFEPFVRLDDGQASKGGGSGLGLAIVQRTLALYDGSVQVEEGNLGGAIFRVRWPRRRMQ